MCGTVLSNVKTRKMTCMCTQTWQTKLILLLIIFAWTIGLPQEDNTSCFYLITHSWPISTNCTAYWSRNFVKSSSLLWKPFTYVGKNLFHSDTITKSAQKTSQCGCHQLVRHISPFESLFLELSQNDFSSTESKRPFGNKHNSIPPFLFSIFYLKCVFTMIQKC